MQLANVNRITVLLCGILLTACSAEKAVESSSKTQSATESSNALISAAKEPDTSHQPLLQTCASCHGSDGIAPGDTWPNLAGQNIDYLVLQMTAFRDGTRENPQMPASLLVGTTLEDLRAIAVHYASQPLPEGADFAELTSLPGAHVRARCISCHGMTGISITSVWPNIAGQKASYLEKQLIAYKDGSREHPIMHTIANELTNEQIATVSEFFSKQ